MAYGLLEGELELELILAQMPDGTTATAAGLSGCACVMRMSMRSGEKGKVWGKRGSARRLNE